MRLEEERTDIRDVLAQCELHWLVGRIPESKVDEMRDELHLHLREATRDGKLVGSVVGATTCSRSRSRGQRRTAP